MKRIKYKTKICKNWDIMGFCTYRKRCLFAHGEIEILRKRTNNKFKTQLCKNWEEKGECLYGKKCYFIHKNYDYFYIENKFKVLL